MSDSRSGECTTVLVTGAAGFLGSHAVERLLAEGYRVRGLDRPGVDPAPNLGAVISDVSFDFESADLLDVDPGGSLCRGVDAVLHLAGKTELTEAHDDPEVFVRANVLGTTRALEIARAQSVRVLVNLSSAAVYGPVQEWPTPEEHPKRPVNAYGASKWLAEQVAAHWHAAYAVPAITLRPFNGYGPRSAHRDVFGHFLAQRRAGGVLTVTGDGSALRDFVYVDDIVEAFVLALRSDRFGHVYNLGSGAPRSVLDLARLMGERVEHAAPRAGEPPVICGAVDRARAELGWSARVSLEDGIARLLAWDDALPPSESAA